VAAQGDLFGGRTPGRRTHVVAAHHRVLATGTEVFVAEHLRWSRGGRARIQVPEPREEEVPEGQIPLFER
jgi:hypothetical protein